MTEGWAFRICSAEAITVSYVELMWILLRVLFLKLGNNMVKKALSWAYRTHRDVISCLHTKFESRTLRGMEDLGVE
jgi:hypothetical protein